MTVGASFKTSAFTELCPFWRITLAAFFGWFLDAFDQTTLMFTLPDIAHDLNCTIQTLGYVLLAQALGRAVGNAGWGWLSDIFGRKPAFTLGVIWFAVFSTLTGFSHSLTTLIILQFLFGIGFGGEWTASASLLMETVPERTRPLASAIMMSGYEIGYLIAAGCQALILPHYGWRVLFFIGITPTLLTLFIRFGVQESPLWLAQKEKKKHTPHQHKKVFHFTWSSAALQAIGLMCFLEFQKAAIYTFYPTILRGTHHLSPQLIFWPITLYCLGSFSGKLLCGSLAERFGNARIMQGAIAIIILTIWPFLCSQNWNIMLLSAFIMGAAASGIYALIPHYLAQRFPSAQRGFGMGLSYALGSLGQGTASRIVPLLGPTTVTLPIAAVSCVLGASLLCASITSFKPKKMPKF